MKLLAAISHHGFGHLAQAAPVLNALHAARPDLALTVWSGLPTSALRARLSMPFDHRTDPADIGLAMRDAVTVDATASREAYLAFHRDWPERVSKEAQWLRSLAFDAVFSDVAYLPLAAAFRAGVPAAAMCSLNWRDIVGAYLGGEAGMAPLLEQMQQAYQQAAVFLCPAPSMPMAWLRNRADIPPVMARGRRMRRELGQRLPQRQSTRWVLLGFGGIGYRGKGMLPELPGITWIAPEGWAAGRPDMVALGGLGVPFIDLLASCDALITKVGYGGFTEAAAQDIPVLYVDRPDWPETPYLAAWLKHHGNCTAIGEEDLFGPSLGGHLERLWAMPAKGGVTADGIPVAAVYLEGLLA